MSTTTMAEIEAAPFVWDERSRHGLFLGGWLLGLMAGHDHWEHGMPGPADPTSTIMQSEWVKCNGCGKEWRVPGPGPD